MSADQSKQILDALTAAVEQIKAIVEGGQAERPAQTETQEVLGEYRGTLEDYASTLEQQLESMEAELEHVENEINALDAQGRIDEADVATIRSITAQIRDNIAKIQGLDLDVDTSYIGEDDEDGCGDCNDWHDEDDDFSDDEDDDAEDEDTSITITYVFTAEDITGHLKKKQVNKILDGAIIALESLFGCVDVISRSGDFDAPTATVTVRLDEPKASAGIPAGIPLSMLASSVGGGYVDGVGRVSATTV